MIFSVHTGSQVAIKELLYHLLSLPRSVYSVRKAGALLTFGHNGEKKEKVINVKLPPRSRLMEKVKSAE